MTNVENTEIEPYRGIIPWKKAIIPFMAIIPWRENSQEKRPQKTSEKKSLPLMVLFLIVLVVITVLIFVFSFLITNGRDSQQVATAEATTSTAMSTTSSLPSAATMTKVINLLSSAGWDSTQYTFNVDESKDLTTSGQSGDFSESAIRSAAEMVAFFQTESTGAQALENSVMESTSATKAEVEDPSNWVAVQSLVAFQYPGNTGLKDGAIFGAGTLSGYAGEIFLVFVAPEAAVDTASNSGTQVVRTACANPQTVCPTPLTPTTPSSGLTPKNPADSVTPPQGVTQLPTGDLTNGQQSADQKASGETSGNVTDNPVGSGTTSGSITSDTGNSVAVGGATKSSDSSNAVKDSSAANYNNGGTNGDTHISDPG